MSWQCPYCETVNQDAVTICTVCERIAPVVESFLSLEQIAHAREYGELLTDIYDYEKEGDFDRMLAAALKAACTYNQNDVAISKIQLAIKLSHEKIFQVFILAKIKENIDLKLFSAADAYIQLWNAMGYNNDPIASYEFEVYNEQRKKEYKIEVTKKIFNHILSGLPSEALTLVETELIKSPDDSELSDIRSKIQNLIKSSSPYKKSRNIPKPTRTRTTPLDLELPTHDKTPEQLGRQIKIPKVKRNK